MSWDYLRVFLEIARNGSIRAAGTSLGLSHSTVLRRLEHLEESFGARLFDRSPDGFKLTAAGHSILESTEGIENSFLAIERTLLGQDARLEGEVSRWFDVWLLTHRDLKQTKRLAVFREFVAASLLAIRPQLLGGATPAPPGLPDSPSSRSVER